MAPIPQHGRASYECFDENMNNLSFWSVQRGADLFKDSMGEEVYLIFGRGGL